MLRISVVISTYNRASFLPGLWENLCQQTLPAADFEVLLINNNSTDETDTIATALLTSATPAHPALRYVTEWQQGLSFGRNRGIAEARAPLICFADDDALLAPDYLEVICRYMEEHPQCAEAGGPIFLKWMGKIPTWQNPYTNSLLGYFNPSGKAYDINKPGGGYLRGSNMCFRTDTLKQCGGFDTGLGRKGASLVGGEEKDMAYRLLQAGFHLHYTPDAVVYHLVPEGRTSQEYIRRQSRGVGAGERKRTRHAGKGAFRNRLLREVINWAGTLLIAAIYLLRLQPAKARMLVCFRQWISQGLLGLGDKELPKVTVLMSVYNGAPYVAEAVQSILNQTYGHFEFIIMDDASTDRTSEILASFRDPRIRVIRNDHNLHICRSNNKGIALAQGRYIARMDADDIAHPRRLEREVRYLQKHPETGVCCSRARVIDSRGKNTGHIRTLGASQAMEAALLFTCPVINSSSLTRTDLFTQHLYDPQALHVEDYEFWLRLGLGHRVKIHCLPHYLVRYRWHGNNISATHAALQEENTRRYLKPYIQDFMGRPITEEEMEIHRLSYRLYKFGHRREAGRPALRTQSAWFAQLSKRNRTTRRFAPGLFDGLLLSRHVVSCIHAHCWDRLAHPGFAFLRPAVLYYAIRFLLAKS